MNIELGRFPRIWTILFVILAAGACSLMVRFLTGRQPVELQSLPVLFGPSLDGLNINGLRPGLRLSSLKEQLRGDLRCIEVLRGTGSWVFADGNSRTKVMVSTDSKGILTQVESIGTAALFRDDKLLLRTGDADETVLRALGSPRYTVDDASLFYREHNSLWLEIVRGKSVVAFTLSENPSIIPSQTVTLTGVTVPAGATSAQVRLLGANGQVLATVPGTSEDPPR